MRMTSLLVAGALFASASIANAADHVVTISGFKFQPATLAIAAGDSVTFVNQDGAPHTASDAGGTFDTGRLTKGQQSGLRFPGAGTFSYFCKIHPNMKAQIVVK